MTRRATIGGCTVDIAHSNRIMEKVANDEKRKSRPLGERVKEAIGSFLEDLAGLMTPEPTLEPVRIPVGPRRRPRR